MEDLVLKSVPIVRMLFVSQNYPWKPHRQQDPQRKLQNSRSKNLVFSFASFEILAYFRVYTKELYHIQLSIPRSSGRDHDINGASGCLACRTVYEGLLRIICNNRYYTMRKSELKLILQQRADLHPTLVLPWVGWWNKSIALFILLNFSLHLHLLPEFWVQLEFVSFLCKPQILCTSFYNTHYLWIFHGLFVIMSLMFMVDYTFHEGRGMSTCCSSEPNTVPDSVLPGSSLSNTDVAF